MKIQVLSQSFYPDHSGISLYASEFAFYASEKGHDVEVITGYGFYPHWKKQKEDRRRLFSTEYKGKVKILRGYIYVPARPTTFKRSIHEISLIFSATFNLFRAQKPDLVVVFTTPVLLGFLSAVFKNFYKSKLVINVQDFQIEAATGLGMSKHKFLFNILKKVERISYKRADLVTSISYSMYEILKNYKNINEKKIDFWPNWIQKNNYALAIDKKGVFRKTYGICNNDIIIAYAGNVGLKQGLEILIDLAIVYKENSRFRFFVVGEGAFLEALIKYADDKGVKNVSFLPLLTSSDYLFFLNDLDVFFLPQKMTEFDVYFPSKLLGLMAARKLILLSAYKESELYKTIKLNSIGYVTDYGDMEGLKTCINEILNNKEKNNQIQRNAEEYVSQFERDVVLDRILEKITKL